MVSARIRKYPPKTKYGSMWNTGAYSYVQLTSRNRCYSYDKIYRQVKNNRLTMANHGDMSALLTGLSHDSIQSIDYNAVMGYVDELCRFKSAFNFAR